MHGAADAADMPEEIFGHAEFFFLVERASDTARGEHTGV